MPETPDAKQPPSWRDLYPAHPCADVYPTMTDAEIEALAEDIKAHGLQQPVVLWRAPLVPRKRETFLVLDGRNRLEALTRSGIAIPSPEDPREMIDFPGGQLACVFVVANSSEQAGAPQVQDPAEFVIGANIRRRHLTKEQQAELIVKTIAAGDPNDRARVARSFSPRRGKKGGSTKDPILAKAVTEAQKHGISKRTVQNARAKLQGKSTSPRKPRNQKPPIVGPASAAPPSSLSTTPPDAVPLTDASRGIELLSVTAPEDLRSFLTWFSREFMCRLDPLKVRAQGRHNPQATIEQLKDLQAKVNGEIDSLIEHVANPDPVAATWIVEHAPKKRTAVARKAKTA